MPAASGQLLAEPGYPNDPTNLTIAARIYPPDSAPHGSGPYPAVIVHHGSGGLWSNDMIGKGLISQFAQWGELLAELGYIGPFPDSFNPRGIDCNFSGKRPHYDPAKDDRSSVLTKL